MIDNLKKVSLCLKPDISANDVRHAIELVSALDKAQKSLNSDTTFEHDAKDATLKNLLQLLKIHENIINAVSKKSSESIIPTLTYNLCALVEHSKSLSPDAIKSIQYQIETIKNEFLDPNHLPSGGFSQEGEDLIFKRLFHDVKNGFYVDVGAHHPTRFSNTFLLYKQGWRGINIDPLPGSMKLFDRMRPNDINIEAAVGAPTTADAVINYSTFKEPAYNFVSIDNVDKKADTINSRLDSTQQVTLLSLDSILEDHSSQFSKINLLTIDVEGFEAEVLKGFSIDKYSPDIIAIEIRNFTLDNKTEFFEYNHLIKHGYSLRSFLFNTLIFKKDGLTK